MHERNDSSVILTQLVEKLSYCLSREELTKLVTAAVRTLTGAEGATFVFKDGDHCYYFDEDAISPLWKGKRFPAETCVSGWSMAHKRVVTIPDVFQDPRVPVDAYRPTFVKSLCMVPIREEAPIGAIGSYWSRRYEPTEEQIRFLRILANSSAVALENLELRDSVRKMDKVSSPPMEQQFLMETFLQSLSHDLKSPLGTILGYAEVLQSAIAGQSSPEADRYLQAILRSGQRLNRQIDRVLALYRMTNPHLRKERLDLGLMAQELLDDLKVRNGDRQIDATVEKGLWVDADAELILIVLENLLSNAVKYTGRKPVSKIHVGKKPGPNGQTEFFIQDNGDGFDPAEAVRLFKPLVRLHEESQFSGTGLGLASAARIVALHQGSIRAEGTPGQGATFFFSLPGR